MMTDLSYLSIGEALAVVSVALLVPQFMKPIYAFRLATRSIRLLHIYTLLIAGALSTLIKPLATGFRWADSRLPELFFDPVFWDVFGGALFLTALALLIFGGFTPAKFDPRKPRKFIQAGADLLAHAEERDRADFAKDLCKNIVNLVKLSSFSQTHLKRDPSKEIRLKVEHSQNAGAFLRLLAEPVFCETLVSRCPWDTASMLQQLSAHKTVSEEALRFVQQIGLQAIKSDRSMVHREIAIAGFSAAPFLSGALFEDEFISLRYRPLGGFSFDGSELANRKSLESLGFAVRAAFKIAFNAADLHNKTARILISDTYRSIMLQLRRPKEGKTSDFMAVLELGSGLAELIADFRSQLANLDPREREMLYREVNTKDHNFDLVDQMASIIEVFFHGFSNDFQGLDDEFWSYARSNLEAVFPQYGEEPDGMDPLQQSVAIKFMKKVDDNMDGWYPALTRVLLHAFGPYCAKDFKNPKSAFAIISSAFYERMKRYPALVAKDKKKSGDYLSTWIRYDEDQKAIVHIYRDGQERKTELEKIELGPSSFATTDIIQHGGEGPIPGNGS